MSDISFTPVASGTGDAQGVAAASSGGLRLVGISITEDAGTPAAARVKLRHGTSASDPVIFDVHLSAGQSAREWFPITGIPVPNGVYVDRVAGSTNLTLFTIDQPGVG